VYSSENVGIRVLSVNVGRPQQVAWHKKSVITSIWKRAVDGAVHVRPFNLYGDEQSDLTVHGGPNKAVYGYPSEHYEYWRRELPDADLPWGAFGENLSTEGLLETDVAIGDRYRIGSAELIVTQPRIPCFKLGIRFGDDRMVKRFMASRRPGFYFAIAKPGELRSGDSIERISRISDPVTIAQILGMFAGDISDPDLAKRALAIDALPRFWKEELAKGPRSSA
jgi:MOSC domain-containing protein YiiM